MASAHNGTTVTSTTGATIYDPDEAVDGPCSAYRIKCRSSSAVAIAVHVAGLHEDDEWEGFEPGDAEIYAVKAGLLGVITVKVASGTGTIDGGKVQV